MRCVGQRCGVFPCCIIVLVKCQVLTCYDVRQVGVVFSERGDLGIGWCGGWVFMVGVVLAGLQRFYLGIWSVRHSESKTLKNIKTTLDDNDCKSR